MGRYRFHNTCRRCINEAYALRLERGDCHYLQYPARCIKCGEICNIVTRITVPGRIRLWLHNAFASKQEE